VVKIGQPAGRHTSCTPTTTYDDINLVRDRHICLVSNFKYGCSINPKKVVWEIRVGKLGKRTCSFTHFIPGLPHPSRKNANNTLWSRIESESKLTPSRYPSCGDRLQLMGRDSGKKSHDLGSKMLGLYLWKGGLGFVISLCRRKHSHSWPFNSRLLLRVH
jgi:hypothetical protein